ncbi:MAG: xanthine dehydrogenase family protein subunit M [Acidobacteria bacterium]|nr:xanthine dehydrogenase family protein subunit M [Acidobacteriota bacterium]
MDLAVQRVLRPGSFEEAVRVMAEHPHALPIAGGTDLVVQLRDGRRAADVLVDLSGAGLAFITARNGVVEIGGATTMDAIANSREIRDACPALAAASRLVGAWPIQCRATLGGNLANASPAADTAPPLLVAEASVHLVSADGDRRIQLSELFSGPGETCLRPGELIRSIMIPTQHLQRTVREGFAKVGPRWEQIISVASLAHRFELDADGSIREARVAVGSVAPTPVRARAAEQFLAGKPPTAAVRREAARHLQDDISPIDDVRAPAWYRRVAVSVLLDRALTEAADG